ncbi:ABC transporter ATP-binding protein/permease [Xanthobacter oligotrophicus]|uniref:ABC transporter ATP-binding protein/permease n=1 Tax=Xanthobacter oligotrophicus TaxID=2607286 RepID=UPI0011F28909|nr:ABC transporter ATP-binding protein/permease [Xanthobacter oligotrophicus]MCG5237598.1 ABC transporter ATP-binding protein/permease [Xanthobacter oligotrophicus]
MSGVPSTPPDSKTHAPARQGAASDGALPRDVLGYLWRAAPASHIKLFALVLMLLPFNYASLELPRLIVNGVTDAIGGTVPRLLELDIGLPDALGGFVLFRSKGFEVSAFGLLAGLALVLFALQLIQQHITRLIEMAKARLGERIIVGLRRQLFDVIQRLRPEAPMKSKALEVGNMMRFEVGPISPFAGMAFAQPLKSAGLIGSATLLIFTQNAVLGGFAIGILVLNYVLLGIQRADNARKLQVYQREAVALGKRVMAGIDRLPLVHGFATSPFERGAVDHRLGVVSEASLDLKRQNFTDRVLNLLMSDVPTLVFYSVGGWLALSGAINIGQLVAVVAAYGQIPEPLKELIDWDEKRLIAQVRYDFARYYLETREVWPEHSQEMPPGPEPAFDGSIKVADLGVVDPAGSLLLEGVSFEVPPGTAVALKGPDAGGKHAVARVCGRAISLYSGTVRVGGHDLAHVPEAVVGRHVAYAGGDPIVITGTLRTNLLFALERRPGRALAEAIDLSALGLADEAALDRKALAALAGAGLGDLVVRLGLERRLDPDQAPALAERIVSLRAAVTDAVAQRQAQSGRVLIEPFRFAAFNRWMTLAENILFATPLNDTRGAASLLAEPGLLPLLEKAGLAADLIALGRSALRTLSELAGGPEDLAGIDTKGLLRAEEMGEARALATRIEDDPSPDERALLLRIAGRYCEPRHRFGLIDEDWQERALAGRAQLAHLKDVSGIALARYQPDSYCRALTVRDNLLFGRIAADRAGAAAVVDEIVRECLALDALIGQVERLSLDVAVGEGGLPLSAAERGKLTLARCLLADPAILVIDDALVPLSPAEQSHLIGSVLAGRTGRTTLVVLDAGEPLDLFAQVIILAHGQVERVEAGVVEAGAGLAATGA